MRRSNPKCSWAEDRFSTTSLRDRSGRSRRRPTSSPTGCLWSPTRYGADELRERSLQEIADGLGLSYKTIANTCSQIKAELNLNRTADLIRLSLRNMQD